MWVNRQSLFTDRYHPIEKLEDDIARQTVLERLGWKFERIRGTAFYRSPDEAMRPIFERLQELDIPPAGQSYEEKADNWTLIHELEDLISKKYCDFEEVLHEDEARTNNEDSEFSQNDCKSQTSGLIDILSQMGGRALVESVFRSWMLNKGYQRAVLSVKQAFANELKIQEHLSTIQLHGEFVSLVKK